MVDIMVTNNEQDVQTIWKRFNKLLFAYLFTDT